MPPTAWRAKVKAVKYMLQLESILELFLTLRSLVLELYNKATVIHLWKKIVFDGEIMKILTSPSVFKSSLTMPQLLSTSQFITF